MRKMPEEATQEEKEEGDRMRKMPEEATQEEKEEECKERIIANQMRLTKEIQDIINGENAIDGYLVIAYVRQELIKDYPQLNSEFNKMDIKIDCQLKNDER